MKSVMPVRVTRNHLHVSHTCERKGHGHAGKRGVPALPVPRTTEAVPPTTLVGEIEDKGVTPAAVPTLDSRRAGERKAESKVPAAL